MSDSIPTVVIGATGYVGGELLRLITGHPTFGLAAAVSSSRAGMPLGNLFPALAAHCPETAFEPLETALDGIPSGARVAVFSAAPHAASATAVDCLLKAAEAKSLDVHAVDVSADFRYADADQFGAIYGEAHAAPALLDSFTCAVPEHADNPGKPHVGHPGCFATAVLLAAVPLYAHGLIDSPLFVTGVTGSTGSGRSPSPGTHHPERHGNLYAYKPLEHRHVPEIRTLVEAATGETPDVRFIPHSGPFARGIYVTAQATLTRQHSPDTARETFADYYAKSPFVRVVDGAPRLKDVVASNYAHLGVAVNGEGIVVMCAIDNLVKGAAGGAVQWMNRLWSLPEHAGLTAPSPAWT